MYLACFLYRNQLTSSWLYALGWYLPIAALAGYLFMTAASNPGYLDEHPEKKEDSSDVEMQAVVS